MGEIWGVAIAAGVGLVGGIMQQSDQQDQLDAQAQNNKDAQALATQREAWLAQQQRKWQLQDTATARAQKSADIGVFQKYHANPADYTPSANLFQQQADQAQSPTWDPTQLGTMSQFLSGANNGNAAAPTPVASGSGTVTRGSNIIWQQ